MYDVAIIGGGPAGSTCASMLKKYMPSLKVVVFEREKFPREHVGESLLPAVPAVLYEMGCWDKVETADFPVKLGATFRWGTPTMWDFEFLPLTHYYDDERPGKFEGQRRQTAWQVDRSIFDEVLLDHSASLGAEVREETKVLEVLHTGDRIDGFMLENGEKIEAKYYIDASGNPGLLRRTMGVEADYPTNLRNIAIWRYWRDTDWAVELGANATRILVLSIGYGWLWFIPIGGGRTSVGLVSPLEYYKASGLKPAELYDKAIRDEPAISELMLKAHHDDKLYTTNDWSYIADRLYGENWFLIGDSCGFADPILSAGLTLSMMGAKQVAYTIMELERGKHDPKWLRDFYDSNQRARIRQHIMFADFWYSANGNFSDVVEYTKEIARKSGFELSSDAAFRWMASGGFAHEDPSLPMFGSYGLGAVKAITERFSQTKASWNISKYNVFEMDLKDAKEDTFPLLFDGKIWAHPCYRRGAKVLPMYGLFDIIVQVLKKQIFIGPICDDLYAYFQKKPIYASPEIGVQTSLLTLEAMIADGWVKCDQDDLEDYIDFDLPAESPAIHTNQDIALGIRA